MESSPPYRGGEVPTLFSRLCGAAANQIEAQRSGFDLERRSSAVNELSAFAGSERYAACSDDEGAYRFRRGH